MLLQYIHIIFLPHAAIYFVKCTSPSCSKAPPRHDAATLVGMVFFGLQASPFFPQFYFVSSDQRIFLQKVRSFSPCAVANRSLAFFMAVLEQWLLPCWAAFQVMLIYDSFYCGYRYLDTFVPVSSNIFTSSFAVVLGLICTFHTKVHSSLGDSLLPERYDGCVVPWCLYLHTVGTDEYGTFRCLEIAPKDEADL